MSDKMVFIAYMLDGSQLLRYSFEYPIVEFWAEPDEQMKLLNYFEKNHPTKTRPLCIEPSEVLYHFAYKREDYHSKEQDHDQ